MTALKNTARTLGLGRALYLVWHWPRAQVARSRREGGPLNQWITSRARARTRAAAGGLKSTPVPPRTGEELEIVGMTGANLWFQTAFCLHSLFRRTALRRPLRLYDDGSLTRDQGQTLLRLFPGSVLVSLPDAVHSAERRLPISAFPRLRALELSYVPVRKLTHVYGGGTGRLLFLDADMIFHGRPVDLENWITASKDPVFMTDTQNAYGYGLDFLARLAGAPVPERLNTGVNGMHVDAIDWPALERYTATLLDGPGSSYYMEQALFALTFAGRPVLRLPAASYIVEPGPAEISAPSACLHHYVNLSKRGYFREAWRRA